MLVQNLLKATLAVILVAPLPACAQAPKQSDLLITATTSSAPSACEISDSDRKTLLSLDYDSFDQSLPDGGWRKYQACPLLVGKLIDGYVERHKATLQKQQLDVLIWHSGQIDAIAGKYDDAIQKMAQTFKANEKPTDAFLWNPYVRATIAFLDKNFENLERQRKLLTRGESPLNHRNLSKVDSFIRCFYSLYEVAYSGTCKPAETNSQRIQSLAVPLSLERPFSKKFFGMSDFLKMKKVILVGEIHGTSTTPELFGRIVEAVADDKSKSLAVLEINQSSQTSIDDFVRTGDEATLNKDPFFSREYQDGRSSRAMVELIKKLRSLPNVTVLCMDPMSEINAMPGQERDSAMASFINSHRLGFEHTVVLSGNIHSSVVIGTPWDKTYRPMGYELKTTATDLGYDGLLNILVRYGKVDSWNCQGPSVGDCAPRYGKAMKSDYSEAVNYPSYFVWENELTDGYAASVFVREAKISFPFVRK